MRTALPVYGSGGLKSEQLLEVTGSCLLGIGLGLGRGWRVCWLVMMLIWTHEQGKQNKVMKK